VSRLFPQAPVDLLDAYDIQVVYDKPARTLGRR
jgi:hypothetical protein